MRRTCASSWSTTWPPTRPWLTRRRRSSTSTVAALESGAQPTLRSHTCAMARHRRLLGVVLAAAALFALWIAFMPHSPSGVRELADDAGPYAVLAVLGVWVVATPSLVSGAVLAAAGGMLLGPLEGSIVAVVGLTLGATTAFVIGRRLGGNALGRFN